MAQAQIFPMEAQTIHYIAKKDRFIIH